MDTQDKRDEHGPETMAEKRKETLINRLLLLGSVSVVGLCVALVACQTPQEAPREDVATASSAATSGATTATGGTAAPKKAESPPPAGMPAPPLLASPASPTMMMERYPAPLPPPMAMPQPDGRDQFANGESNPLKLVSEAPVSTFSADVDTASYAMTRRMLTAGRLPPKDAVRVEEMINYFPYAYPLPKDKAQPFRASVDLAPAPWNSETRLLRIGIKGFDVPRDDRPPANLVFLVDVSGSMGTPDRLPLLQQSLKMLVDGLDARDHIALVTYAGQAGVALEPTSGADKARIKAAIDGLGAGGSTAGAAGLETAYQLAQQHFSPKAVNRIILGTDGDFNVGQSDPDALETMIAAKRKTGIYLSVLGFGMGNLQDRTMQKIAQAGNGTAAYVDTLLEARKVLVEEMGSTLFPIANDVKLQVEFNPSQVRAYRLIGYETRMLRREDFNNDKVDAGEIGSGHTVTALYEITPADARTQPVDPLRYGKDEAKGTTGGGSGKGGEIAFLKIRYKLPGEDKSRLIERPITRADMAPSLDAAAEDFRFAAAVAGFGQLLRQDTHLGTFSFHDVEALAQGARGADRDGYRAEFIQLVRGAQSLSGSGR